MNFVTIKRFGTGALQAVRTLTLVSALMLLVAMVSLSGSAVRMVLADSGVDMRSVFAVCGSIFAASAALSAASGAVLRKIGA